MASRVHAITIFCTKAHEIVINCTVIASVWNRLDSRFIRTISCGNLVNYSSSKYPARSFKWNNSAIRPDQATWIERIMCTCKTCSIYSPSASRQSADVQPCNVNQHSAAPNLRLHKNFSPEYTGKLKFDRFPLPGAKKGNLGLALLSLKFKSMVTTSSDTIISIQDCDTT